MLTIKQIKREIRLVKFISYIFNIADGRNRLISTFFSICFGMVGFIFVFLSNLPSSWFWAIGSFSEFYLLTFFISCFFLQKNELKKTKEQEDNFFTKLNKKEKKHVEKAYNKLSESTKKYLKENKLKEEKVYKLYINSLKNEKIINILNNLKEIVKDLNKNKRMDLKCYLFDHIVVEINKEEFNIYKDEIIQYIEKEFDNEDIIYFLEKMKELKLKYDDEEINKYKNQLKEDISTNKIPKEKKLIQSI